MYPQINKLFYCSQGALIYLGFTNSFLLIQCKTSTFYQFQKCLFLYENKYKRIYSKCTIYSK